MSSVSSLSDLDASDFPEKVEQRLVIAVDYGTTFTGLAYATPEGETCALKSVDVVVTWNSTGAMSNIDKVPSRVAYALNSRDKTETVYQWGAGIPGDKVTMVHTKLELDPASVAEELESIKDRLQGMANLHFGFIMASEARGLPPYTRKTAEEIVTDYLTNMLKCAEEKVEVLQRGGVGARLTFPTDIVITVPTHWSERAMNATYRAMTKAGFNDMNFPLLDEIIFITESEAAALYTARYYREKGDDFLKVKDSFVLCDAGGGTVDVVSYTVTRQSPLQLELVSAPTGKRCGAIFVDMAFKKWLKNLIGEDNYKQLDPYMDENKISSHSMEGGAMAKLMRDFNTYKEDFDGTQTEDMSLDLPEPLHNLTCDGVDRGEVIITCERMKEFFSFSILETIGLIRKHLEQIRIKGKGRRTRNVFLVGGFGRSKYLRREVEIHLKHILGTSKLTIRTPEEEAWTAIVRGAVLCGVEKSALQSLIRAKPCKHHYGIAPTVQFSVIHDAKDDGFADELTGRILTHRMLWLLDKGDLVLSTKALEKEQELTLDFFVKNDRKKTIVLYGYSEECEDDVRPERYFEARDELTTVCKLVVDLNEIPKEEWKKGKKDTISVNVIFKIEVTEHRVTASVWRNGEKPLAAVTVNHE